MSTTRRCPKCGAELPANALEGLCPRCVAKLAFAAPKPGTKVRYFGDYELLEEIARGGMGIVYKARQMSLNRVVAVKMILRGGLAGDVEVQRFRAEAEAAANLQHPNIVAIHEVGEHEGQPYFSMDYIEGHNLAAMVKDEPLPARRAAAYLKTIAEAIHHAHQKGTLHRDLKPSNVLIDGFDQPRVTDFGLAKRLNDSQPSTLNAPLTETGQVLGTPSYAPPEQVGGRRAEVGPQSDVYSLGALLYFLVTARPPFTGKSLEETLSQVLNKEPVSPRHLNPNLPRDLETICLKCLEKDSRRRYASAQELADELGRFLRDEPIQARPAGQLEKLWRRCRRQPVAAGLAAGLLLTLVTLICLVAFKPPRRHFAPIPVLSGCGVSGVIDGNIFVHTGCDGWTGDTNHFHGYGRLKNKWEELARPPIGHTRGCGGVINGKFYLVGGADQHGITHGQLHIYDQASNAWSTGASMPTARWQGAAAVLHGKLYVLGGNDRTNSFASVEIYDPDTGQWTDGPKLLAPRVSLGAAVLNGTLYVLGGSDTNSNPLATVEILTPTDQWVAAPSLRLAVVAPAVAAGVRTLYVAGGWAGTLQVSTLQAYVAGSSQWDILEAMPEARTEGSGAVFLDGLVYVIGGWKSQPSHPGYAWNERGLPHDDIFVYDTSRNSWKR